MGVSCRRHSYIESTDSLDPAKVVLPRQNGPKQLIQVTVYNTSTFRYAQAVMITGTIGNLHKDKRRLYSQMTACAIRECLKLLARNKRETVLVSAIRRDVIPQILSALAQ